MGAWFWTAQALGLITLVFAFVSYQRKEQRKYLFAMGISYIFWTLMFLAMGLEGNMTHFIPAMIVAGVGTLRCFVFWWILAKESKKRKIGGRVFLLCFLIAALTGGIIAIINSAPEVRILQWIIMVTALLFTAGQYIPNKHFLRMAAILYATAFSFASTPLYILEGDFRWNPIGIAIEASKILSVIIFYILLLKKRKTIKSSEGVTENT
ncbi:MAG: hypothetical protein FWE01_00720 [Firmicutes bacterium]|nr:hypothetical protein [Bacillota bacterium]